MIVISSSYFLLHTLSRPWPLVYLTNTCRRYASQGTQPKCECWCEITACVGLLQQPRGSSLDTANDSVFPAELGIPSSRKHEPRL